MTQQTIPSNDGRITSHVGTTPSTGPFGIDFPFSTFDSVIVETQLDGSLDVVRLTRGVDYTLTGTSTEDGTYSSGTITLLAAIANANVSRFRNTVIERLSNFPLQGYLDRLSLNAEFNRITMAMQDFQRRLVDSGGADDGSSDGDSRFEVTLQVPAGEAGITNVLASPIATRASRALVWSADGNLSEGDTDFTALRLPTEDAGHVGRTAAAVGVRANRLMAYDVTGALTEDQPRGVSLQIPAGERGLGVTAAAVASRTKRILAWNVDGSLGQWRQTDTVLNVPEVDSGLVTVVAGTRANRGGKLLAWDVSGNLIHSTQTLAAIEAANAPLDSPVFTGDPRAPTPAGLGDNDTTIPTTAWVQAVVASAVGGSTPTGPAGGDLIGTYPNPTIKASVILTGKPKRNGADAPDAVLLAGATMGIRFGFDAGGSYLEGVDNTGTGSFEQLTLNGSRINVPNVTAGDNSSRAANTAFVTAAVGMATGSGADFFASGFNLAGISNVQAPVTGMTVVTGNAGSWFVPSTCRFTPPAGRYMLYGGFSCYSSSSLIIASMCFRKNGTNIPPSMSSTSPAANNGTAVSTQVVIDANGTDYFELTAWGHVLPSSNTVYFGAFDLRGVQGAPGPAGPTGEATTVLQTRIFKTGSMATGAGTLWTAGDTIPTQSQGTEFMSLVFTPLSATSRLIVTVEIYLAFNAAPGVIYAALHQDAVANALAMGVVRYASTGAATLLRCTWEAIAGSTTLRTFRVRGGANQAGTTTLNGEGGVRYGGGVLMSSIKVQEVAP